MEFTNFKQQLTSEEINNFEKQFQINLPDSYKNIILKYNGGYPVKRYFRGGGIYFTPIKYGNDTLEDTIDILEGVLPKHFFPFAEYGSIIICLSLEKGDNKNKIYYFYEDGEIEEVAESLDEFMDELSDDPNY